MDKYNLTKKGGQWKLKKEGSERASKNFEGTKEEALKKSIEFMKNHGGSLKIHKVDGDFQEERTYPKSADPTESKG